MQTRMPEEDRGKYWAQNMMLVKADRFKKGQISYVMLLSRAGNRGLAKGP